VPLPLPLAPAVMVIQLVALLVAVQAQPVPAVTVMVPLVCAAPGEAPLAESEYVQVAPPLAGAEASCTLSKSPCTAVAPNTIFSACPASGSDALDV
jgi:hypothetical protein